jgi:hypothetical protein
MCSFVTLRLLPTPIILNSFKCVNKCPPTSILVGLQDFAQTACYSVHHKGLIVGFLNHNILCSLSSLNIRFVILFTVNITH